MEPSIHRDELADLINRGQTLCAEASDESKELPEAEAQEWVDDAREWISENFDELEVALFNSNAGELASGQTKSTDARRSVFGSLSFRVKRLRELAREL